MSTLFLPPQEIPTPTLEEVELDQYVIGGKPFKALLTNRQHLKQMIADAEKAIEDIDLEVGASLDLKGVKSVIWITDDGRKNLLFRREASKARSTLDRSLLLAAGVTPLQLQAGSKLGKPGKSGITIRSMPEKGTGFEDTIRVEASQDPFPGMEDFG